MDVDIRLLFPMSDTESARFMRVKARCLRRAGYLDTAQHQIIQQRVERLLARAKARHDAVCNGEPETQSGATRKGEAHHGA